MHHLVLLDVRWPSFPFLFLNLPFLVINFCFSLFPFSSFFVPFIFQPSCKLSFLPGFSNLSPFFVTFFFLLFSNYFPLSSPLSRPTSLLFHCCLNSFSVLIYLYLCSSSFASLSCFPALMCRLFFCSDFHFFIFLIIFLLIVSHFFTIFFFFFYSSFLIIALPSCSVRYLYCFCLSHGMRLC